MLEEAEAISLALIGKFISARIACSSLILIIQTILFTAMEPLEISNYTLGPQIGKGAFSIVFKGFEKEKKLPVAVKRVTRWEEDPVIEREIIILNQVRHPNIVNLINFEKTEEYYFIVLEYCKHGDLQKFIQENTTDGRLPEWQAQKLFQQIFLGMRALFEKKIVHRDLKLENVLIDENYVAKIADFGWSRLYEKKDSILKTYCGTPMLAAPEILRILRKEDSYDEKCDIWSLGVMLYKILLGNYPYNLPHKNAPVNDLLTEIDQKDPFEKVRGLSEPVMSLLKGMLTVDPNKRISFHQLMSSRWATGDNLYPSLKFQKSDQIVPLNGLVNWVSEFSPQEIEFYFSRLQAKELIIIDYLVRDQPVYQGNATIYSGFHSSDKKREFAIKVLKDSQSNSNICSREYRILSKIDHPNIIKCFGYHKDLKGNIYLIYEWSSDSNLEDFIKDNFPGGAVPEHQTQKIAQQIFAAMKCLKEKGLVHRELQLENVLVCKNFTLKLTGFDSVYEENDAKAEIKKPKEFLLTTAPGVLEKRGFSTKSEVWSLGVMLYQLLVGNPPFKMQVYNSDDILKQIKQKNWPQVPENISIPVKNLLISMLTVDSVKRADFKDLFSNSWISGSFHYFRLRVTIDGIFSDLIRESYSAEEWFPDTDEDFKLNYPLIMLSQVPEVSTQSDAKIQEPCKVF